MIIMIDLWNFKSPSTIKKLLSYFLSNQEKKLLKSSKFPQFWLKTFELFLSFQKFAFNVRLSMLWDAERERECWNSN